MSGTFIKRSGIPSEVYEEAFLQIFITDTVVILSVGWDRSMVPSGVFAGSVFGCAVLL